MNNKEFIASVASQLKMSQKEAQELSSLLISDMLELMDDEKALNIQGFGSFEIKKKIERVIISPITKKRMLFPPKLSLAFKPSVSLKEKVK